MDDATRQAMAEFAAKGIEAVKFMKESLESISQTPEYQAFIEVDKLVEHHKLFRRQRKRWLMGKEMTQPGETDGKRYFSAFDNYEFMGFRDPDMRPGESSCEGCPEWDSINGCWDNCRTIVQCKRMGEEPHYLDAEWDNEAQDYM